MQTDQNRRQQAEFDRQQRELQRRNHETAQRNAGGGGGGGGGDNGCFSGDTLVRTPSGWTAMADIKVGDVVTTVRSSDGQLGEQPVFKIRHLRERTCLKITTESGGVLRVTPHHPLFQNGGWQAARRLRVGGTLTNFNGSAPTGARIVSVESGLAAEDVFHLYCGTDHTYIVEHAISHCFAFARGLQGALLDARCALVPITAGRSGVPA